jgi:heterodisulfide reductase subunit B
MCQANLDTRQEKIVAGREDLRLLPVFYVTELMGLALGLVECQQWWTGHCVDPRPLLQRLNLLGKTPKMAETEGKTAG